MNRALEKEAAEALLDRGVSVPFKDIRLPFRKKPLKVRVTMKRPTLAGQIEIGRQYLEMDITAEEVRTMPKLGQMRFIAKHGKCLSRIIAYTVCTDPFMSIIRSAERTNPVKLRLSQGKKGS